MALKFHIITNLDESKGLSVDFELLSEELLAMGHEVHGIDFRIHDSPRRADVNIFCETMDSIHFPLAKRQWYIPNPEWHQPVHDYFGEMVEAVLCKTQYAYDRLARFGEKRVLTGFLSRDHYRPEIPRERVFLHCAGTSQVKNTAAVLDCWEKYQPPARLVVTGRYYERAATIPNVVWYGRATEEEKIDLQNRCLFHLLPSQTEGWGHSLHEGMSCGAIIITTDGKPMSDFADSLFLTAPYRADTLRMAEMHLVDAAAVNEKVQFVLSMNPELFPAIGSRNRKQFRNDCADFRWRFQEMTRDLCNHTDP